jgi:dTDP-glucose 4,6-dehydratase
LRRVLVTGGAGFIGSNFVHYWLEEHPQDAVIVLDALTYAGSRANLVSLEGRGSFRFVHGDICDESLVLSLLRADKIDTVVHFAAETHVDRSIGGPDVFVATNVVGTHCMLKAARQAWLKECTVTEHRFHHVSTDEVYGSLTSDALPFTEATPYAPSSPYAASKAASDHLVRAYHHTYGLRTTISNCSNNYGPRQFPEKLIPLCVVNLLLGHPVPLFGDGRNTRDWLHVSDHCRGIERILLRGRIGEVYHLGGGNGIANIDLVGRLCELVDEAFTRPAVRARFSRSPLANGIAAKSLIRFVADRPGHDRRYAMNTGKARCELDFEATQTIEKGLRETVAWYLENDGWWREIMSRNLNSLSIPSPAHVP